MIVCLNGLIWEHIADFDMVGLYCKSIECKSTQSRRQSHDSRIWHFACVDIRSSLLVVFGVPSTTVGESSALLEGTRLKKGGRKRKGETELSKRV